MMRTTEQFDTKQLNNKSKKQGEALLWSPNEDRVGTTRTTLESDPKSTVKKRLSVYWRTFSLLPLCAGQVWPRPHRPEKDCYGNPPGCQANCFITGPPPAPGCLMNDEGIRCNFSFFKPSINVIVLKGGSCFPFYFQNFFHSFASQQGRIARQLIYRRG